MNVRMATVADWASFGAPALKVNARDYIEDVQKTHPDAVLLSASNATYSGYYLNRRVYPGIHMEQGVSTWCCKDHGGNSPYDAPVLMHHDKKGDSLGNVVKAQYHRLKDGEAWYNDWQSPETGMDKGSGYTRLTLAISDSDAQAKILDGRLKTLSTSFRSPQIMCSICMTNLLVDGCDHKIGQTYELEDSKDERTCYLVTGQQFNKECSFVHDPAQPWAVVDEVKWVEDLRAALSDSSIDDEALSRDWQIGMGHHDIPPMAVALMDSKGNVIDLNDTEGAPPIQPRGNGGDLDLPTTVAIPDIGKVEDKKEPKYSTLPGGIDLNDEEQFAMGQAASALIKAGLLKPDADLSDLAVVKHGTISWIRGLTSDDGGHTHDFYVEIDIVNKKLRGWTESTFPTKKKGKVEEHGHSIELDIEDLNADEWAGETRDSTFGDIHRHTWEVVVMRDAYMLPSYDECLELATAFDEFTGDEDRMGPAMRRKIERPTFVGPAKTFPITDCASVDAARRLFGRARLSSAQRDHVRERINERALALGADRVPKDSVKEKTPMDPKPGDEKTPDVNDDLDPKDRTIATLTDSLDTEKSKVKTLQSDLDTTKNELKDAQEALTDSNSNLHRERCERLAMVRGLSGFKPEGHVLDTAAGQKAYLDGVLIERSVDSIKDALADETAKLVAKIPQIAGLPAFIKDSDLPEGDRAVQKTPPTPKKKDEKPKTAKELV